MSPDSKTETKPRALIADDDELVRAAIGGWLRDEGFAVSEAGDSAAALEVCVTQEPDVAILDFEMPGCSGAELASVAVEQSGTPIVLLSSHDEPPVVQLAITAGVLAYLMKPVEQSQFLATVRTVMQRGRELRELRAQSSKFGRALEAGRTVNLATGLIMGRMGVTQKEAFETLRHYARSNRTRLEEVADELLHATDAAARLFSRLKRAGSPAAARTD
jgi:response regulator NasT